MAGITLKIAQEHLSMWLEAEGAVATSQSYRLGTRSLTRADLKEILNMIKYWEGKVINLENQSKGRGRNRMYRGVPYDL